MTNKLIQLTTQADIFTNLYAGKKLIYAPRKSMQRSEIQWRNFRFEIHPTSDLLHDIYPQHYFIKNDEDEILEGNEYFIKNGMDYLK